MQPQHQTLDEACKAVDDYYQGKLTSEDRQEIREDLRLSIQYPRQFVAYIDEWRGEQGARTLCREILVVSDSVGVLNEQLQARDDLGDRTVRVYAGDEQDE